MIGTESKLWQLTKSTIERQGLKDTYRLTRVESGATKAGISDVEYVVPRWHGWVEYKVSSSRASGKVILHHAFSLSQWEWLLHHHEPAMRMRSWVLIGFTGVRSWREFMLVPAPAAGLLLHVREAPTFTKLENTAGVEVCDTMVDVIKILGG